VFSKTRNDIEATCTADGGNSQCTMSRTKVGVVTLYSCISSATEAARGGPKFVKLGYLFAARSVYGVNLHTKLPHLLHSGSATSIYTLK
jgi:hypothetical protein